MFLAVKKNSSIIHCTCSKVTDEKYRQSVCSAVCYFSVNIPLFFNNCIPFRSRSRPVFYGSGSGSGSGQTVSAAPAPAPAPTKMCRLRRLRLRLRLRLRIPDLNCKNIKIIMWLNLQCIGGYFTGFCFVTLNDLETVTPWRFLIDLVWPRYTSDFNLKKYRPGKRYIWPNLEDQRLT